MSQKTLPRRQFLKGMGGLTLALPILPSLLPREAWGQTAAMNKKRFVAIHSGHCQAVEHWLPDNTRFTFTQQGAYAREVALSGIQGNISPVLGTEFNALRSKLLLLSRLDPTSSQPNHNAEVLLTGGVRTEISNSMDQILAQRLTGSAPLNVYVRSVYDNGYSGASHLSVSNGNYSAGQFNPSAVFASLFGSAGSTNNQSQIARRDLAVVDRVHAEFRALLNNPQLSAEDTKTVQRHRELIANVEERLRSNQNGSMQLACTTPTGPGNSPVFTNNAPDYQVVIDQMFDVIEVAVKCGRVEVATMMLHAYDYFSGSIGFINGINSGVRMHEDVGHAGSDELRVMKLRLNQFFAQRVARFLTNLNVIEDAATGRTYLDNSIVMWGNDQGAVANAGAHASINIPLLVAGSAGGFLQTGKYVDYGPAYAANINRPVGGDEGAYRRGRPYNQFLVTVLQAMGLSPADYETVGRQGFGVYGDRTATHDYLGGNHRRELLPLIKA